MLTSNPNGGVVRNCTDPDEWYFWTGFHGYYHTGNLSILADLGLNDVQQVTAAMLLEAAQESSVWNVVDQLGDRALVASSYISLQEYFWSPALPDNQWQIEVGNWFGVGLAQIQRIMITNFRPPTEQILLKYWKPFPNNATKEQIFCASQKVRNANYTSFSIIGLALNFGLGGFILLAGHGLPKLIPYLQSRRARRSGGRSIASDQWIMNSAIQQQRMVFQLHGKGYWVDEEKLVPTTINLETFAAPSLVSRHRQASIIMASRTQFDGHDFRQENLSLRSFEVPVRDAGSKRSVVREDLGEWGADDRGNFVKRPGLPLGSTSKRWLLSDEMIYSDARPT